MRSYEDPCGVARALDLVGERWALLVVRELLYGPKRFTDLRAGLPGASQNVLSHRVRELEAAGVVERRKLGVPVRTTVYELTERGHELKPVVAALGRWGSRAQLTSAGELSVDAFILALEVTYNGKRFDGAVQLRMGDDVFTIRSADGALECARGQTAKPDAVITGDVETLRQALFAGGELRDVTGHWQLAERFAGLFPRPTTN
ncbi:helix-turn-helix domain-containing protein [Actinokineospora sp. NBRC 105648]|uniref:winged helix-turn-helix transcriptional regulator n=1 Tax=Actinokineospora sp. NBRC 105648 TaxID=3032206 RepID=UPI0024A39125|nr:helix-turn-helix domain-containing protein [Actinokineospora sp. NBRC 105648]GLZ40109.1 transcriptional regulator [Actinokineospora sp. NBRC 105648]